MYSHPKNCFRDHESNFQLDIHKEEFNLATSIQNNYHWQKYIKFQIKGVGKHRGNINGHVINNHITGNTLSVKESSNFFLVFKYKIFLKYYITIQNILKRNFYLFKKKKIKLTTYWRAASK